VRIGAGRPRLSPRGQIGTMVPAGPTERPPDPLVIALVIALVGAIS
jgi:hypothetical protein